MSAGLPSIYDEWFARNNDLSQIASHMAAQAPAPIQPPPGFPTYEAPSLEDPESAVTGWGDRVALALQGMPDFTGERFRNGRQRGAALFLQGLARGFSGERVRGVASRAKKIEQGNADKLVNARARFDSGIKEHDTRRGLEISQPFEIAQENRGEARAKRVGKESVANDVERDRLMFEEGKRTGRFVPDGQGGWIDASTRAQLSNSRWVAQLNNETRSMLSKYDVLPAEVFSAIKDYENRAREARTASLSMQLAGRENKAQRDALVQQAEQFEAQARAARQNAMNSAMLGISRIPEADRPMVQGYINAMLSMDTAKKGWQDVRANNQFFRMDWRKATRDQRRELVRGLYNEKDLLDDDGIRQLVQTISTAAISDPSLRTNGEVINMLQDVMEEGVRRGVLVRNGAPADTTPGGR